MRPERQCRSRLGCAAAADRRPSSAHRRDCPARRFPLHSKVREMVPAHARVAEQADARDLKSETASGPHKIRPKMRLSNRPFGAGSPQKSPQWREALGYTHGSLCGPSMRQRAILRDCGDFLPASGRTHDSPLAIRGIGAKNCVTSGVTTFPPPSPTGRLRWPPETPRLPSPPDTPQTPASHPVVRGGHR
jgi:hypothetical protein